MDGTLIIFWAFAGLAVVSALSCITRRSPVASALWLVVTLFSLAALFVLLDAQFIAVLQVLVYAGAIMVLFLFVVMLLNAPHEETERDERVHPLRRPGRPQATRRADRNDLLAGNCDVDGSGSARHDRDAAGNNQIEHGLPSYLDALSAMHDARHG